MYKQGNHISSRIINPIVLNRDIHKYDTRHIQNPHTVYRRTLKMADSIFNSAPKFWASLPEYIKYLQTFVT